VGMTATGTAQLAADKLRKAKVFGASFGYCYDNTRCSCGCISDGKDTYYKHTWVLAVKQVYPVTT